MRVDIHYDLIEYGVSMLLSFYDTLPMEKSINRDLSALNPWYIKDS